jgi:potassium efflux system protein
MDWDWVKSFPEALKGQFKAMKITVNWEKPGLRYLLLSLPVCRCC